MTKNPCSEIFSEKVALLLQTAMSMPKLGDDGQPATHEDDFKADTEATLKLVSQSMIYICEQAIQRIREVSNGGMLEQHEWFKVKKTFNEIYESYLLVDGGTIVEESTEH